MAPSAVAFAVAAAGVSSVQAFTVNGNAGRAFLGAQLQPDVVAATLVSVESEWKKQATLFISCSEEAQADNATTSECDAAPEAFQKSCGTVVASLVQGSSGKRADVQEYLSEVCAQGVMKDWKQTRCSQLEAAIVNAMTADDYENREKLNSKALCTGLWSQLLEDEGKEKADEAAKEKADEEARAKAEADAKAKAEEEAKQKAAADAEAAKKQAEEAAKEKAEADAKAAEEAKKAKEEAEAKKAQEEAEAKKAAAAAPAASNATATVNATQKK